jgi:type IV secretion system protein TrbL
VRQRILKPAQRLFLLIIMIRLSVPVAFGQAGPPFNTTVPSQIMDQFRNSRILWTANVFVYANTLFGILAVIEFAWSAAVMLLEKSDLQTWTSALIRKLMWIGAFYGLLLNGRIWIPAIIDSFTQIGQNAAGLGALSPSGVFIQGLRIAGALLDGASTSAFFINPGPSLSLAFAALVIVISYTLITINFIVTLVESYLAVSVGFIFLGFGGSRWTAPYTERYIGLAVSIGIKIVVLYCLISAGFNLSLAWVDEAQGISGAARPIMTAFDVMGGALIFMMCCWQIPKLFAAVIGGSPALTGGDLIATGAAVAAAGIAAGGAAVSAVGLLAGGSGAAAGTGSAASAGGTGSNVTSAVASVGSVGSHSGGPVRPPSAPSSASSVASNDAALRTQPDPPQITSHNSVPASEPPIAGGWGSGRNQPSPSSILSSIGGEPLAGSGFETEPPQRGFMPASVGSADTPGASVMPSSAPIRATPPSDAPGVSSASEITSVTDATSPSIQPSPAGKARNVMTRAVDQARSIRQRIRSLPSDSAPHATPPRIPIDHEE